MGWLLIFLLISSLAMAEGETVILRPGAAKRIDTCYRYDVDGCSIPCHLPFFFKTLFTHSCNRHDICYHCGVAYNLSKHTCDTSFRKDTMQACNTQYKSMGSSVNAQVIRILTDRYPDFRSVLEFEATRFLRKFEKATQEELQRYLMVSRRHKILAKWVFKLSHLLENQSLSSKSNSIKGDSESSPLTKPDVNLGNVMKARYDVRSLPDLSDGNSFANHSQKTVKNSGYDIIFKRRPDHRNQTISKKQALFCKKTLFSLKKELGNELLGIKLGCEEIFLLSCYLFSNVYYLAVDFFASSSYHHKPEFYCHQDFVKKCLPPIP